MESKDLARLDYPRHVHQPSVPGAWVYLRVEDAEACAVALAAGWSLTPSLLPYPSDAPAGVVEPVPEAFSAPIVEPVKPKAKRGRWS